MKNKIFVLARYCLVVMSLIASPQLFGQKTITGTVMDGSLNETLIGATVQVKGKTAGTISDINGKYSIIALPTDILVFSYIGMDKQEVTVGDKTVINITLSSTATQLNEVVAIGYGTVKKSDLTGSVAVVSAKELTKNPSTSAAQALQGKAAGVLVSQSGAPGGGATIRVRGVGSISKSADPIYILDGVPVGNIDGIQPQDIESLQVLKDASSTAIYGANGSNGVIIITTKRGKSGKVQVNLNTYLTYNLKPEKYNVMNADQYSTFYSETLFKENGLGKTYLVGDVPKVNPAYALSPEFRQAYYGDGWQQGTDWQDLMFKNSVNQNYNLSLAGGGENSNFNVSFGYTNEDGTIIHNNYERYQIRANSDFKLSKYVKIGQNFSAQYTNNENPVTIQTSVWDLKVSPLMKVYNPNILGGFESYQELITVDGNNYQNTVLNDKPNLLAAPSLSSDLGSGFNTSASVYLQVDVTDWLMLKLTPTAGLSQSHSRTWIPKFTGNRSPNIASLDEGMSESMSLNLEGLIQIKKTFNNAHNFLATGVYVLNQVKGSSIGGLQKGYDFESINTLTNGGSENGSIIAPSVTGSIYDTRLLSYLGRVMYDYKGKYYATASIRSDGTSVVDVPYRRGEFFSGSLAWRVNADFFKDIREIDALKLRIGYGQTGNSNIGSFNYLTQITPATDFRPVFGDTQQIARAQYKFAQMGNPIIRWEAATMSNFGIDLNMFNGKLQTSAEYYIKDNNGLLVKIPTPSFLGFLPSAQPWYNIATMQNKGIEITAQWRDKIGEVDYGISSNFTTIDNVVKYIPSPLTSANNKTLMGQPIGCLYGYVSEGIIQLTDEYYTRGTDGEFQYDASKKMYTGYKFANQESNNIPQPGDLKYSDLNGDGQVTALDKTIIGKTIPSINYTFGFDCTYKQFDFNIFLNGVTGFQIFNQQRANLSSMNTQDQMHNKLVDYALNHWTIDNPSTTYVRVDPANINNNDQISSFWVEDGSYLRIKDVQIGYNLPEKNTKKLGVSSFRVYANASNLYNFTKYKGRDPESFISSTPLTSGTDNGNFAIPRSFTCGLQIGF